MQMGIIAVAVTLLALGAINAFAVEPGNPAFQRTWERTDKPVADFGVDRTWMWGDKAFTNVVDEEYQQAPGGMREVQYYDKSRMEINNPDAEQNTPWYVTNGLLVVEMTSGRVQIGDQQFEERAAPANIPVAGDPDDADGPTYGTIAQVLDAVPFAQDSAIIQRLNRNGTVTDDPALAGQGVTAAQSVQVDDTIDHMVANVFWDFMNSTGTVYEEGQVLSDQLFENPFYATGYPITEAYWARVIVGEKPRDVLMQCFERRCLTYTPDNDPGWRVEAGNVGRHYYSWVYEGAATPTATVTATATATATATPDPLPEQSLFVADLSGENERPDPVETDANGNALFHVMEDGSAIEFQINVNDIQNVTAAHIHMGGPDEVGPVVATLFTTSSGSSVTPTGALAESRIEADDVAAGTSLVELAQLLADGDAYVNVHTTSNPDGDVRGQVAEVGTTAFNADLDGDSEIPAVVTDATGLAMFLYDAEGDSLAYELSVADIDGVEAVHIREGKANQNGPVVALLFGASAPINPVDGVLVEETLTEADLIDMSIERVVYLMLTGHAYINVNTSAHVAGEIRGQVGTGAGIDFATEGTFVADLSGANENPEVATSATGDAVLSFNADGSLDYALIVARLDEPEAAHIHLGGPVQNGPVIVPLWDESMSAAIENGLLDEGTIAAGEYDLTTLLFQLQTGSTYVNVHTEDHPDGEIRGQLRTTGEVFMAQLTDEEVVVEDPMTDLTTTASGIVLLEVNAARTSINYTVVVDDLEATTAIDLYTGAVGSDNAGSEFIVSLFVDDPLHDPAPPTEGAIVTGTLDADDLTGTPVVDMAGLLAAMADGTTFVQVHTVEYPFGELRGQIEAF